ncbi:late competence development ComFB family protein [Gayadomonas joobiniege]|uniref:late competence development ComFB family protein n=1 Tax=Gayadomonas joobiniege TaxID=1234606 RepID=UPI0003701D72|nr:late competence development ComFB family protein [Gayadomonas joobiniege]
MKISDEIHNYYETLVSEALENKHPGPEPLSDNELADLICLTLNQLPAKYIRHDVDLAYYLSSEEREQMKQAVHQAIEDSLARLM